MALPKWHIAQINVARAVAPLESPELAEFVAALDGVNRLAEASPGFVWRLKTESGNATDIRVGADPLLIVNMSLWASVEELFYFVYKSAHTGVMVRRREWFEKPTHAFQAMWWVAEGYEPTVDEGFQRLEHLREHGPTLHAFTFKERFPPPGTAGTPEDMKPEPYCVGWT